MGLGIVVVEICEANLLSSLDIEQLEEEFPEIAVLRLDCLNLCGLCRARPYAMVNGNKVFAKTSEECLALIRQQIQAELAAFHGIDP
ncbi:hypothetical protein J41TS12_49530 [Paenibacillus antibioticophila]|uniref:DUF1450 domain-containing protein n=1 Tax=Paenibacillus antibioticophila TaxID=1274374 RepID=A0A920CKK6_9BACL|nr:DUF1450 domain-containing protein [Paenibacillus antibioticophila]GIO40092.1 hypothetical protein J41TS12_49530 [Paenibacillus antibioticophila]